VKATALALVATTLVLAAGCGRPASNTDLQQGPPCSEGSYLRAGTVTDQITVDGKQRTYMLTSPGGSSTSLRSIVFDFPGLGESAKEEAAYSHLAEQAAARGFIGVTAQAEHNIWTIPPLPGPNDVDYFKAVVDDVRAHYCADATAYVAGISNGAAFAGALACQTGVFIRGVAMIAGINAYAQCHNGPLRVIGFNGTADPIVPYNGGNIFGGPDQHGGGIVPSADQAFRGWGSRNECFGSPVATTVTADVQLTTFSQQCSAPTELYTLVGGGHTWPGATPVAGKLLGPTNESISATKLILDFFAS